MQINNVPFFADGVTYEPWTDGYAVGFKITHRETGNVEYLYLNPSSVSDDGQANVFLYHGDAGNPGDDEPLNFINVHDCPKDDEEE